MRGLFFVCTIRPARYRDRRGTTNTMNKINTAFAYQINTAYISSNAANNCASPPRKTAMPAGEVRPKTARPLLNHRRASRTGRQRSDKQCASARGLRTSPTPLGLKTNQGNPSVTGTLRSMGSVHRPGGDRESGAYRMGARYPSSRSWRQTAHGDKHASAG
jgi:hypothetical protein